MCVLGLRVCVFANISSVYRICVCSVMRRMKLILLHRFCFNYFNLHSDGEKKSECFKKYKCILITFIQLIPIRPLLKFWLRVMNAVLAISETLAPYSVPASCTGSPLVRGSLMSAWRPRFCLPTHRMWKGGLTRISDLFWLLWFHGNGGAGVINMKKYLEKIY